MPISLAFELHDIGLAQTLLLFLSTFELYNILTRLAGCCNHLLLGDEKLVSGFIGIVSVDFLIV